MEFRELTQEEFQKFLDNHELATFFQDPKMENYSKKTNRESHYVGVIKDGNVIAATRMTSLKGFLGMKSFYAPRGFLIDYNDFNLMNFFVNNLKKYLKSKKCYRLHIDPYVLYKSRDINGNITDEFDNTNVINNLKKLGFEHGGFTVGHDPTKQIRWQYVLNIKDKKIEEITKDIKANHKNLIRKAEKYGVEIEEISYDKLDEFKKITSDTSNRIGFEDRSLLYYQSMYQAFGDKVKFIIANLKVDKYKNTLNDELSAYKSKYENTVDKETGKARELKIAIEGIEKRLEEIKSFTQKVIPISAAMFMLYGREVDYLFSGSIEKYKNMYAQYLIQWEMIKYACENKFERYNFFGISGNFDKKDKNYGVYEFKKGFGGNVEELVGDFYLSTNFIYKLYKFIFRR